MTLYQNDLIKTLKIVTYENTSSNTTNETKTDKSIIKLNE